MHDQTVILSADSKIPAPLRHRLGPRTHAQLFALGNLDLLALPNTQNS